MLVVTVKDNDTIDEVVNRLEGLDYEYMSLGGFTDDEFPIRVLVDENGEMEMI